LQHYYLILILGIVAGLFGVLFHKGLLKFQDIYKIPKKFHPLIAFLGAGVCAALLPGILGGGQGILEFLATIHAPFYFLLLILAGKLVFTWFCYGSGVQGGIFLPILAMGGVLGLIFAQAIGAAGILPLIYKTHFAIIAMAGVLSAVVRSPILAIILMTEMTGSFMNVLPIGLVSITAYVIAQATKCPPVYGALLERMLHKQA